MTEHTPIVVTIVPLENAGRAVDGHEGWLYRKAIDDGVLIDAANPEHRRAFGVHQFWIPEAWLQSVAGELHERQP